MNQYGLETTRGIVIRDGKMLVFERWRRNSVGKALHYFSIPGGRLEGGETPEEAVIRELKEEMTIDVDAKRLLYRQQTDTYIHNYFLCSIVSGEPIFNLESEEASRSFFLNRYEVKWLPMNEVLKSHFPPAYKEALEIILPTLDVEVSTSTP